MLMPRQQKIGSVEGAGKTAKPKHNSKSAKNVRRSTSTETRMKQPTFVIKTINWFKISGGAR